MRTGNQQKRESEILAQFSHEVGHVSENIDALIAIVEQYGHAGSEEYDQIIAIKEFFSVLLGFYNETSGWVAWCGSEIEMGKKLRGPFVKLRSDGGWWPVLKGEYAVAASYELEASLDAILSAGNQIAALQKEGFGSTKAHFLYHLVQKYSQTITAVKTKIGERSREALEVKRLGQIDKSERDEVEGFTEINGDLLESELQILKQMTAIEKEFRNTINAGVKAELTKVNNSLRAHSKFHLILDKGQFTEFKEWFQSVEIGPLKILNHIQSISNLINNIQPLAFDYMKKSNIPPAYVVKKGDVISTYRHLQFVEEAEKKSLRNEVVKLQSSYVLSMCNSFALGMFLKVKMGFNWPESFEEKERVFAALRVDFSDNVGMEGDKLRGFLEPHLKGAKIGEEHLEAILENLYDKGVEQVHFALGEEIKQLTLEKEWLQILGEQLELVSNFFGRYESAKSEISKLLKNPEVSEDLFSNIKKIKTKVNFLEKDKKDLLQRCRARIEEFQSNKDGWKSIRNDGEFLSSYSIYKETLDDLESRPSLEGESDELNNLLLSNLDQIITENEKSIAVINNTLKIFHRSYGVYQSEKSQVFSPAKSTSKYYQTRLRIAKNHKLSEVSFQDYYENADLLRQVELEISNRKKYYLLNYLN